MTTTTAQRRSDGEATYRSILDRAVDLASAEGLEGLTIGRLAGELGMSKSGLFAHFGSKKGLQLATVDAAGRMYAALIWDPVADLPPGLPRLAALLDSWVEFVARTELRGGCFFSAASHEFDGRPGDVRDRVVHWMRRGQESLEREATAAVHAGDLLHDTDPIQLVFELYAFIGQAVWRCQLFDDAGCIASARSAIRARLDAAVTDRGRELLTSRAAPRSEQP